MGTEALWIPLLASVAGSVVSGMMAPKPQKPADPAAPVAPPQATKAPDINAYKAKNAAIAAAAGGGPSSTLLTGTGGVDPGEINLGKNTLLGS